MKAGEYKYGTGLGLKTYAEKLTDPRWQKKRLEILNRAQWKCEVCGNDKESLHCHHCVSYRRIEPWEYEDHEYQCLCETHHKLAHNMAGADVSKPEKSNNVSGIINAILQLMAVDSDLVQVFRTISKPAWFDGVLGNEILSKVVFEWERGTWANLSELLGILDDEEKKIFAYSDVSILTSLTQEDRNRAMKARCIQVNLDFVNRQIRGITEEFRAGSLTEEQRIQLCRKQCDLHKLKNGLAAKFSQASQAYFK